MTTREQERREVFDALFRSDGDRKAAAKRLGVSERTFYRRLETLDLYGVVDRMGWKQRNGPPRAVKGSQAIKERLLKLLEKYEDPGDLTWRLWGVDVPSKRNQLFAILEELTKDGLVVSTVEGYKLASRQNSEAP